MFPPSSQHESFSSFTLKTGIICKTSHTEPKEKSTTNQSSFSVARPEAIQAFFAQAKSPPLSTLNPTVMSCKLQHFVAAFALLTPEGKAPHLTC